MIAVAAVALAVMFGWASRSANIPVWAFLVLSGLLVVSSVCALRFVRGDKTRTVSRLGYGAMAVPLGEAFVVLLGSLAPLWTKTHGLVFACLFSAFCIVHLGASIVASARAFSEKGAKGDLALFPLFLAWMVWVGFFVWQLDTAWSK